MTTAYAVRLLSKGEKVNGDPNIGSVLEKAANEIESLTTANQRLREALEEAITYGSFPDLCWKWRQLLNQLGEN